MLIDIREADEHARERIPGARHHALSRIDAENPAAPATTCWFSTAAPARAPRQRPRLAAAPGLRAYILEGGLDAWKKAGLPVAIDRRQPIDIMRQVQIAAGSLVLIGVLLGSSSHPDSTRCPVLLAPACCLPDHWLLRHGASACMDALEQAAAPNNRFLMPPGRDKTATSRILRPPSKNLGERRCPRNCCG